MSQTPKPIRVFWSPLSQRFYASRAYKQINPDVVEITGQKFDVTDDIAAMIIKHDIVFTPKNEVAKKEQDDAAKENREATAISNHDLA